MRNRLLASAGLGLLVLAATATITPALAQDCGCRDQVRAALKRQHPAPQAVRHAPVAAQANAYAYGEARPVDMYPYRHRWEAAPQGPVAPPPMEQYGEYAPPMPYGAPMAYGPPATAMPTHYANPAYPDGWAYGYQAPGIEIDQQGWFGGVGYGAGGDGGGGGGGGMTLTMAQPDASNGYTPGSGGSFGAANQLRQWRMDAFAPKASK